MGARGPRDKPAELKVLQGNPGKRQLNNAPKYEFSEESRKPPSFLGKYAKKEWKRILPLLERNRLITDADIIALSAYCQAVDTWVEAEKKKREFGFIDITDKGNVIQRPEVAIANKSMELILKFGREFGLTPSSRSALNADSYDNRDSPLLELMKRAKEARA